jgi:hypothetical protein
VVDEGNSRIVQIVTNVSCIVAAQPFTAPSFCPKPASVHSSSSSSTAGAAAGKLSSSTSSARRVSSSSSSTKGK